MLSRTSRLALSVWVCAKFALGGVMLYETTYSRIPFAHAFDQWEKAQRENNTAGMLKAEIAEKKAICASLFAKCPEQKDCSAIYLTWDERWHYFGKNCRS